MSINTSKTLQIIKRHQIMKTSFEDSFEHYIDKLEIMGLTNEMILTLVFNTRN